MLMRKMVSPPSTLLDIFITVGGSGGVIVDEVAPGFAVTYHWRDYQTRYSIQECQRVFADYFGMPLKPAGVDVVPSENVPEPYLSLLNEPTGSLLLSMLMKSGNISLQDVSGVLQAQFGSCTDPPANLAKNQTLYGQEIKRARRVEMALICPHHSSDNATFELTDFYLSPDRAIMQRLAKQLGSIYPIVHDRGNSN